ncbi:MAG: LemA family protein [bacterium]|nr:LemA family protein [bacterium]
MIYIIFAVIICVGIILTYNYGIQLRNYVREAFSTMDVYLKKRWDLIPNLIDVVKSYSEYEKGLLSQVTQIRARDYDEMNASNKIDTNRNLGQVLGKIIAVAENYPDIKANQTYEKLMTELSDIENDIANSRKYYNATVRQYNNYLEIFPTNLIGAAFRFEKAKMFEISEDERQSTRVDL